MNVALAQRLIALAGIALLAIMFAVAFRPSGKHGPHLPRSIPPPGGGWYTNLMAPNGTAFARAGSSCGFTVGSGSLGLSTPLYPCRTKIWIHYNGTDVLTQVISHDSPPSGSTFELSPALASKLGLHETREIQWRFAGGS